MTIHSVAMQIGISKPEEANGTAVDRSEDPRSPRSDSHRAKSSRQTSLSPERSPRHKHSKRHKKEHSHKKSKRSRHEDDAHLEAPPAAAVSDTRQSDEGQAQDAAGEDDIQALREAALQTTKAAVTALDIPLVENGSNAQADEPA